MDVCKHISLVSVGVLLLACDPGSGGDESGEAPPAGIGTISDGSSSDTADAATGPATDTDAGDGDGGVSTDPASGTSAGGDDSSSDGGDDGPKFDIGNGDEGTGGADLGCDSAADEDRDMDGWTKADGDCNDCDPNVNPGAIEVEVTEPGDDGMVPEPADEDCDGNIDNVPQPCDAGITFDDTDPLNAAAAIGLCDVAEGPMDQGIVSAQWVRADGTVIMGGSNQHGILTGFGPNVMTREGENVLGLSSGRARLPGQTDFCGGISCNGTGGGTAPAGFPQDVPGCSGSSDINDDIALEVTLRAPSNATGYSFDFDFYSYEYPEWVCTSFNDQFIALVDPAPEGSIDGNISFDAMGNPVSVNIAFFDVCAGCPLGEAELTGTGFDQYDDAGATSWLSTTAPIEPGAEFTIRFTVWDTGDSSWDSTVLIDNFQWIADGGTVDVGTEPAG